MMVIKFSGIDEEKYIYRVLKNSSGWLKMKVRLMMYSCM
jgi:hypothetical protein